MTFSLFGQSSEIARIDFYSKGLQYRNHGAWQKALDTWLAGCEILQLQNRADLRIGIAFIETVTQQKAAEFYELASEMYLWGFSQPNVGPFQIELENEIDRLAPLMDVRQNDKWQTLALQNPAYLFDEIISFWREKDPLPSTRLNERLIEHYQRIAYVQKEFKLRKNSVYETDDRGLIYVKYGEPDLLKKGILGGNRLALKKWIDMLVDYKNLSRVDAELVLQSIERFNTLPEYELWLYRSLESNAPQIFIFGRQEGKGLYGLRTGIEEFIPARAFYRSNTRYTGGISPGGVLQSLYYSELMHIDRYFADRLNELDFIWHKFERDQTRTASRINTSLRQTRSHFQIIEADYAKKDYLPSDKSNFYDNISFIAMKCVPFRFLDDENRAMLNILIFSYPQFKRRFLTFDSDKMLPDHFIIHTLILRNAQSKEIQRLIDSFIGEYENQSSFQFEHKKMQNDYVLIAEAYKLESDESVSSQDQPEKNYPEVIGVGKTRMPQIDPLTTAANRLELSDLVLGMNPKSELQNKRLPFPVIPNNKFRPIDNLKIYLEIYHLLFDKDGQAHFVINFKVKRNKKNKKSEISLSFDFDSNQSTSKEQFNIDISKLKPGRYELFVEVTDRISLQKKERKVSFEIIEDDQIL